MGLVLIFIFRIKRFIFDILKRGLLILLILVNLFLLILARFRRWTSAGSNVLWSELSNKQQQWATLLQCQHHLRTNPHFMSAGMSTASLLTIEDDTQAKQSPSTQMFTPDSLNQVVNWSPSNPMVNFGFLTGQLKWPTLACQLK